MLMEQTCDSVRIYDIISIQISQPLISSLKQRLIDSLIKVAPFHLKDHSTELPANAAGPV